LAIHAIDRVVDELTPLYGKDCPVAVAVRVSWPDQRVLRGTLGTIRTMLEQDPVDRTALVLVGPALDAAEFRNSALYDPDYRRRFRE
jgi:precorrin-4/cobalt-precorrin-4 C11-methyltransferase